MEEKNNLMLSKEINLDSKRGVLVTVDFCNIPLEKRNQIEKVADDFLNLVTEIIVKTPK